MSFSEINNNISGKTFENSQEKVPEGRADIFVVRHLNPSYPAENAIVMNQAIDEKTFNKLFTDTKDTLLPPDKSYKKAIKNENFELAAKEGLISMDEKNKEHLRKTVEIIKKKYEELGKPPIALISSPVLRALMSSTFIKSELDESDIKCLVVRSHDILKEAGNWADWRDGLKGEDKDAEAVELWFDGDGIEDNEFIIGKNTMRKRGMRALDLILRYSERIYDGKLLAVLVTHNTVSFTLSEDFDKDKLEVGDCYELDLSDPKKIIFKKEDLQRELSRDEYFKV